MEENRPRRSRPEMGTPEHEEWRKCMLERRRKRLQRERRNRLIAIGAAVLLVSAGISAGVTAFKEKNTARYTTTTITNNTLVTKELERKYVLLPVWMVNVKYKEKNYIFAMNGQTGEFIGDNPIDKKKAWIYSIIMFIVLSLVIFIIILLSGIGG